jgi:hypothetical protein
MSLSLLAFAAPPNPLHPLIHALTPAYVYGPWLVMAAVLYSMLRPYLKGGR